MTAVQAMMAGAGGCAGGGRWTVRGALPQACPVPSLQTVVLFLLLPSRYCASHLTAEEVFHLKTAFDRITNQEGRMTMNHLHLAGYSIIGMRFSTRMYRTHAVNAAGLSFDQVIPTRPPPPLCPACMPIAVATRSSMCAPSPPPPTPPPLSPLHSQSYSHSCSHSQTYGHTHAHIRSHTIVRSCPHTHSGGLFVQAYTSPRLCPCGR